MSGEVRLTNAEAEILWDALGAVSASLRTVAAVERIIAARVASAAAERDSVSAVLVAHMPGWNGKADHLDQILRAVLAPAADAATGEWTSGVCENDDGPREATSHCVLPRDHAGEHTDDTDGSWR